MKQTNRNIVKKLFKKILIFTENRYSKITHTHNDSYYLKTEIDTKLLGKSNTGHTHNDLYYTESEIDSKITSINGAINGKSDIKHQHTNYAGISHVHDSRYYTESEINSKLSEKANSSHTHDSRYYTESEIDTKLLGKSNTGHTHNYSLNNHTHDDRYYTEFEVDSMLKRNLLRTLIKFKIIPITYFQNMSLCDTGWIRYTLEHSELMKYFSEDDIFPIYSSLNNASFGGRGFIMCNTTINIMGTGGSNIINSFDIICNFNFSGDIENPTINLYFVYY